jgi:hypothetical protein
MNIDCGILTPRQSRLLLKVGRLATCWPCKTEEPLFEHAAAQCGNECGPVQAMLGAVSGERSLQPSCTTPLRPSGWPPALRLRIMVVVKPDKSVRSYAELRALIRASLRSQHPEWIEPNGNSPMCDEYDARLAYLLGLAQVKQEHGGK